MPHTISFTRPYKSITSINTIELPDITVITGTNGSGKSHLLQAISLGYVSTSETPDFRKQIRIFDWNTIVPVDNKSYSIAARTAKIDEAMTRFEAARNSVLTVIQQNIENNFLERDLVLNLDDLQAVCDPNYFQYFSTEQARNTARNVQGWMSSYWQYFVNSISNENYELRKAVRDIWTKDYRVLMFGRSSDIRDQLISEEHFSLDLFSQAFAKIFVDYMHRWQKNYLSQSTGEEYLSEDEFIEVNQIPPWDFVNNILEESRLPFRINSPSRNNFLESFEPKLTRVNSAVEMRFGDLSSGEKVLMSFALCVYNATGKNPVVFPRVLLLDEVDAPLHPEMVDVVLRVMKNILVDGHDIKVILTTHKPTTVALAPEGSIYQMLQSGPELTPISREKAVSILTVGIPTMAFTTDMRLQVFTEASIDATVFGRMYQLFKSKLPGSRSIEFIQSGRKGSGGDLDAGRSRVNNLVSELRRAGASTVLGIVDWDGRDNNKDWVYELCRGKRHSLENLFLDPVILVSLLARDFTSLAKDIGVMETGEKYLDIFKWNTQRWQTAVDLLGMRVLGCVEDRVDVNYANSMSLSIPRKLLLMRGHDLVHLVKTRLNGSLDRYPDNKLLDYISQIIVPEIEDLVPRDIIETLEEIIRLADVTYE